jgi:hypothetical protein
MAAENATTEQTVTLSGRYVIVVGGLVVLIIGILAYLYAREVKRTREARVYIAQLEKQKEQIRQALMQMGPFGTKLEAPEPAAAAATTVRPFQREDHVPVPVTLDGERRQAYRLPASGAMRFGFREGDVILVTGSPASATAATSKGAE